MTAEPDREPETREELERGLKDARERTLLLVEDLPDEELELPPIETVNPILWEIGHVAWFQENWVLRHRAGRPPIRADADALYDSSAVAHHTRWTLPLPDRGGTLAYMERALADTLERLASVDLGREECYFHRLALYHEDMHGEALVYTRQALGYPPPRVEGAAPPGGGPLPGDVELPGGTLRLGAERDVPFAFDNEQWAHEVEVRPFLLARAPVTQMEYVAFVEDAGYARPELWSGPGWRWRQALGAERPLYWRRIGAAWERRHYDRWVPLEEHLPMLHVNAYEAEAYARWTGRRLPTEAEWELAAGSSRHPWGDSDPTPRRAHLGLRAPGCVEVGACPDGEGPGGCRQLCGNLWEWTASTFCPYPGFEPGPYRDYSAPWFGTRRVLRGGAFATQPRLLRNTWRNFFTPDRRDVLAGFRTAALPE